MNEQFFHDRAREMRRLADNADPFTRKRLLELADRYDRKPRPPTVIPTPKGAGLTDAVGFIEEVLAIPSGGLVSLVEADDTAAAQEPTVTSRLLSDIVQGRE
jgi:hypothetical protein